MPRFPDYRAEIGLNPGTTPQIRTGAEAIGQGLQALGGGLSEAAAGLEHYQKRLRQEAAFDDDNKLSLYKQQRQAALAEAAKTMPAEATSFTAGFAKTSAKADTTFLGTISAGNRQRVATDLLGFNDGLLNQASQFEYGQRGTFETNAITAAYQTSLAAIRRDPSQRGPALAALNVRIDGATSIPAADRARLKRDIASGSSIEWAKGTAGSDPDRMSALVWGAKTTLPKGAIGPAQADRESAAMSYFIGRGYSREQAAGIVGNLVHESAGLAPSSRNPGDGSDGSDSVGIAQWNGDRARNLQAFAAARGKDWRDLSVQLAFVDHELNTDHAGVKAKLLASRTPDEAAGVFVTDYERPAGSQGGAAASHGWDNRRNQARRLAAGDYKPGEVEEKAPDPVVASLSADDRSGLVSFARAQRSQGQAVAQGDLEPRIQDATRALTTIGRYDGRLPTAAEFSASYGPEDGARRYRSFERTLGLGADITAIRAMTPAEQTAWLAARAAKGQGPAFETERQLHERGSEAIALNQAFRRKDPNGYIRSLHPQIDRLWTEAGTSLERLRAALAATNAAMDRLGMPVEERRLMPKAMVDQALAAFSDKSKPLAERIAPIRALVTASDNPAGQADLFRQANLAGLPRLAAPALAAYGRGEDAKAARLLAAAFAEPAGSAASAAPVSPLALRGGGTTTGGGNMPWRPARPDTAIDLSPALAGELDRLRAAGTNGLHPLTATLYDRLVRNNLGLNGGDPHDAHAQAGEDIRPPAPTRYAGFVQPNVVPDVPPRPGTDQDNGGARVPGPVVNTPSKPPFEMPERPGQAANQNDGMKMPTSPGATIDNSSKSIIGNPGPPGVSSTGNTPGVVEPPPSLKPGVPPPTQEPFTSPLRMRGANFAKGAAGTSAALLGLLLAALNGATEVSDPYPGTIIPRTYVLPAFGGVRVSPEATGILLVGSEKWADKPEDERNQDQAERLQRFNIAAGDALRQTAGHPQGRELISSGGYDFIVTPGTREGEAGTILAVREAGREPSWYSGWFGDEGEQPGRWFGTPPPEIQPNSPLKPGQASIPPGTPGLPGTSPPEQAPDPTIVPLPGTTPLGTPKAPVFPQAPGTPAQQPRQGQTSPITASGQDKPPGSGGIPPAEGAPAAQGTPTQDSDIDPAEPNSDTANDNLDKNKKGTQDQYGSAVPDVPGFVLPQQLSAEDFDPTFTPKEGAEKRIYVYKKDPSKVIAISLPEEGLSEEEQESRMQEEFQSLKRLRQLGIPTIDVFGITKYENQKALILERIDGVSSKELWDGDSRKPTPQALDHANKNTIRDLEHIRDELIKNNTGVEDLQFMIDKNGRARINDPMGIDNSKGTIKDNKLTIQSIINVIRSIIGE